MPAANATCKPVLMDANATAKTGSRTDITDYVSFEQNSKLCDKDQANSYSDDWMPGTGCSLSNKGDISSSG